MPGRINPQGPRHPSLTWRLGRAMLPSLALLLVSCVPTAQNLLDLSSATITIESPSTTHLPDAVLGRTYSLAYSATGGVGMRSWSNPAGDLNSGSCAGLTLSAGGILFGTPAGPPGVCNFTVQVRDSRGDQAASDFSISIEPALTISPFVLGNGVLGRVFSQAITVTGGIMPPTACSASPTLPIGLSITASNSSCLISGTPQQTFSSTDISVSVADSPNAATGAGIAHGSSLLQINLPLTVNLPSRVMNGLVGFTYPGITFTATGGTGNGSNITWTQAGAVSASGLCVPAGTMPPGLSVAGTTGVLSGVPTTRSARPGDFQFQVCVEDSPTASTAAASAISSPVVLNVLGRYAYISSAAQSLVIMDTANNTFVGSVALSPYSSLLEVAVSPDGRYAFAVDNALNQIIVVDTITNTQVSGSPFALPVSCVEPWALAIPPDPTGPSANRVYVSCSGADNVTSFEEVVVLDISNLGSSPLAAIPTGLDTTPAGLAISSDNSRVYVALNNTNQLFVIDNTLPIPAASGAGTFDLDPTTNQPLGIALATNGNRVYAYISKQYTGNQTPVNGGADGIEVVDVTTDQPSTVETVLLEPGVATLPTGVTVDPEGRMVFVTLPGSSQLAILDNTLPIPTQVPGSPFALPDPNGAAISSAYDVAFPPVPAGPPAAYIPFYYPYGIALLSDTIPPLALPGSPIASPQLFPFAIRAIPIPR